MSEDFALYCHIFNITASIKKVILANENQTFTLILSSRGRAECMKKSILVYFAKIIELEQVRSEKVPRDSAEWLAGNLKVNR